MLRQVINTYPLLNTVEILTAAGKLISKVKGQPELQRMSRDYIKTADPFHFKQKKTLVLILSGFHYEACNETDKMDFEKAIETIAVAFSSK